MNVLETTDVSVHYGGVCAVDGVTLAVPAGKIVGLIGPNGAGKTSLIDALTGFTRSSGKVSLNGEAIDHLKPHHRARLGLTRTFQSMELFEDLTVEENLQVGAERQPWWAVFRDLVGLGLRNNSNWTNDPLHAVGLAEVATRMPTELSHGQRKLVSVARALAAKPQVVLLDEPAAGLDSAESLALGEKMRGLLDHGLTALLIDHDMGLVLGVCDYIYVLDFGRIIAEGNPTEISRNPVVLAAYLGEGERKRQDAEQGKTEQIGING